MTDVDDTVPPTPTRRRWVRGPHVRAGALIGVLIALLGFAIAAQVRSTSADPLAGAREDDLIRILDDQDTRADNLRLQLTQLEQTEQQLRVSGNRDTVALQQAEQQAQALGILLGTLPATGPGIVVTITDPKHALKAEDLLDVIEELRGAGAEAMQFGSVRVSTDTAFTDDGSQVAVDGVDQVMPYTVLAIGDPQTLQTALQIPGGVAATVRADGGTAQIVTKGVLDITVTHALPNPRYARPVGR